MFYEHLKTYLKCKKAIQKYEQEAQQSKKRKFSMEEVDYDHVSLYISDTSYTYLARCRSQAHRSLMDAWKEYTKNPKYREILDVSTPKQLGDNAQEFLKDQSVVVATFIDDTKSELRSLKIGQEVKYKLKDDK